MGPRSDQITEKTVEFKKRKSEHNVLSSISLTKRRSFPVEAGNDDAILPELDNPHRNKHPRSLLNSVQRLDSYEPLEGTIVCVKTRSSNRRFSIMDLPNEILTKILLNLDTKELYGSCCRVCKRFNLVISGDFFTTSKSIEDFGGEGYLKLVNGKIGYNLTEMRRFLNVNLFRGMSRLTLSFKPYVHRIKLNHRCSESVQSSFCLLASSHSTRAPPTWMDRPLCCCVFRNSVSANKLLQYSEIYGWCIIDLEARGVPTELLDLVRPPIAVGVWDPHPEGRFGFSMGLRARLVGKDSDVTLAKKEYFCELGANGEQPISQQIVFTDYPIGVRRVILFGPNSFLVQFGNSRPDFTGVTVKLLTFSSFHKAN